MTLLLAGTPGILYPGGAVATTSPHVKVVQTTASLSKRMARLPDLAFSPASPRALTITVRDQMRFQTIAGFGASMTLKSAEFLVRHNAKSLAGIAWHCYFGTPVSMSVSAAVERGARRIATSSFVTYSGAEMRVSRGIDDVAFLNPTARRCWWSTTTARGG